MKSEDLRTMEITVSPSAGTGEVECDIAGQEVMDDASWDQNDPFCARPGKCPRPGHPTHPHMGVKAGSITAKAFTVQAREEHPPKRRVFHYRLNFADGRTCDPIIIRD